MKKFFRRLGWTVLTLIVLVLAIIGEENWRGKHAWEKYRLEREAMGDRFELSAIVPPPVPDADNFAATPAFAELFPKLPEQPRLDAAKLPDCAAVFTGNWRLGRVENLAAWQKAFTNDNLLAALAKYDPILNEITEASHRPKCRFPIRYEENFKALLPHVGYMRSLARTYRLRAQAELAAGHGDGPANLFASGGLLGERFIDHFVPGADGCLGDRDSTSLGRSGGASLDRCSTGHAAK